MPCVPDQAGRRESALHAEAERRRKAEDELAASLRSQIRVGASPLFDVFSLHAVTAICSVAKNKEPRT